MARSVGLVVLVGMRMLKPRSRSELDRVQKLTTVPSLVKNSHVNLLMLEGYVHVLSIFEVFEKARRAAVVKPPVLLTC